MYFFEKLFSKHKDLMIFSEFMRTKKLDNFKDSLFLNVCLLLYFKEQNLRYLNVMNLFVNVVEEIEKLKL